MVLTTASAEWLLLMLGYGLLVAASRQIWLGLRGWHVFGKEDVPMVDFVAVLIPWGFMHIASTLPFAPPAPFKLWLALAAAIWLLGFLFMGSRTGIGLRWRALGTDPAGLTRLGVNTLSLASWLAMLGLISTIFAMLLMPAAVADYGLGNWALAGLAVLLLGGRLGPILIVVAATVTIGVVIDEQSALTSPLAFASASMMALLLLARRWRESDQLVHVD